MRREDISWSSRVVSLILSVGLTSIPIVAAVALTRGYAHWETAKEQYIVARVALNDNIQLLQISFEWEKKSGSSAEFLPALSKEISELEKELIKIDDRIRLLMNFSFLEKVIFPEKTAATAKYLATILSLKRQESTARVVNFLGDCQKLQKTN